jgi:phosphotransferase system  glucose/maltose/N-acetylglucosamine-specific IIC component
MKSVTRLVVVSALLVVVGLSFGLTSAFAKTVSGTVVSMDGGMLVIRTTDGQEQHFTLGTGVTVPTDVRTGSMVEVNVGDTGDQTTVVSSIRTSAGTTTTTTSTYNSTPSTSTSSSTYGTTTSSTESNNQYANTASPIWAYALVGLFGLAGAMAFRRWRVAQG